MVSKKGLFKFKYFKFKSTLTPTASLESPSSYLMHPSIARPPSTPIIPTGKGLHVRPGRLPPPLAASFAAALAPLSALEGVLCLEPLLTQVVRLCRPHVRERFAQLRVQRRHLGAPL